MSPRERDGCECPGWVLRCAHFDGSCVRLTSIRKTSRTHKKTCDRWVDISDGLCVELTADRVAVCACGGTGLPNGGRGWEDFDDDEIDAALVAFARLAEELLESGVPS